MKARNRRDSLLLDVGAVAAFAQAFTDIAVELTAA